jgi:hypothetical protein
VEIIRLKNNFKEREEALEIQISQLKDEIKQKGIEDDSILKENRTMKIIIENLKKKNENFEKLIEDMKKIENNLEIRQSFARKKSVRIKNKFKKIVKKVIPMNANNKRMSILDLTKKLKFMKKINLEKANDVKEKNQFLNVETKFNTPIKDYKRKNLKFFSENKKYKISNSVTEIQELDKIEVPKNKYLNKHKRKMLRTASGFHKRADNNLINIKINLVKDKTENKKKKKKEKIKLETINDEYIGNHLVKDIEQVSKFYLIPDGGMKHQTTQMTISTQEKPTQTEISLTDDVYNNIFKNNIMLKKFVEDYNFRINVSHKNVIDRISVLQNSGLRKKNSLISLEKFKEFSKRVIPRGKKEHTIERTNKLLNFKKSVFEMIQKMPEHNEPSKKTHFTYSNYKKKSLNQNHLRVRKKNYATQRNFDKICFRDEMDSTGEKLYSRDQIKEIFEEFINEELLNKFNISNPETKLIWITKFFMNEEMKNEKLINENKKIETINNMLKKLFINKDNFEKEKNSRSVQLSDSDTKKIKKINDDIILKNKKMLSHWKAKKTVELNNSYKSYIRKKKNKVNIFEKKQFKDIWRKLHVSVNRVMKDPVFDNGRKIFLIN